MIKNKLFKKISWGWGVIPKYIYLKRLLTEAFI